METKVQKQAPQAFYLGLVVVFAALILAHLIREGMLVGHK